jgi:hypothetical protein
MNMLINTATLVAAGAAPTELLAKSNEAEAPKALCSAAELASLMFEPWEGTAEEHGKGKVCGDTVHQIGVNVRIGHAMMFLSKEHMMDAIRDDAENVFSTDVVDRLIATQQWLEETRTVLHAAEIRWMCALAAVEQGEDQAAA